MGPLSQLVRRVNAFSPYRQDPGTQTYPPWWAASVRLPKPHLGAFSSFLPPNIPLQSTPPTILLNLPRLPPELEYRIVGRTLVLRDAVANIVVDLIPDAIT